MTSNRRNVFCLALLALALLVLPLVGPSPAAAQSPVDEVSPRIRIRLDTVLRWTPQYVLDVRQTPEGREQSFWRSVDQIPLYERMSLDARHLADGHLDIHMSAWGVLDTTFGVDGEGEVAGDFAVGYARYHRGPVAGWAGRRFVPWGPPGGLHVDGGGAEVRLPFGLMAEAFAGRPVTPTRRSLLGPSPSLSEPTVAYGGRVGYARPGRVAASVAFVERWAGGIRADRLLTLDASARPHARIQANTDIVFDVTSQTVEQATVLVDWLVASRLDVGVGFSHVEPASLLPAWSILSVFEASVYDEGTLSATVRPSRRFAIAVDASLRHYRFESDLPQDHEDDPYGYRIGTTFRLLPSAAGLSLRVGASRRYDGVLGYTVVQGSTAFVVLHPVVMALEAAFAIDDEGERESLLARVALDAPLTDRLRFGGAVDVARTPIAEAELRVLLRLTYRRQIGGGT